MKLFLEGNTSEVLTNMGRKVLKQYLEALASMSSALSKQLGKYDMYSMVAGMVFVFQVSAGRGAGVHLFKETIQRHVSAFESFLCRCRSLSDCGCHTETLK